MKLYRLIWQRFVASQMMPAVFDVTTAKIAAVSPKDGKTYDFRSVGRWCASTDFSRSTRSPKTKRTTTMSRANKLPNLDDVKALELEKLEHEQHFTSAAAALQRSIAGEGA